MNSLHLDFHFCQNQYTSNFIVKFKSWKLPNFDSYRELKTGGRCNLNSGCTMSENCSVENSRTGYSSVNAEEEVLEMRTLTQEAVNEQIQGCIVPLTRQLEELTLLVQGMVTTPHPSIYPRTDYSTISGTAAHQPDTKPINIGSDHDSANLFSSDLSYRL